MATATIQIDLPGLTGFTLTLDLYPRGSDTASVSGLSLTEATNRKGTYTTTTAAGLSGVYYAVAKEGTTVRGAGYVTMSDTTAIHIVEDEISQSDAGADLCTLTINVGASPLADADVWITTDSAGTNVVAGTKQTNSLGQVSFLLDEGITYFLWMQKDGYNPILGDSFVAVAD